MRMFEHLLEISVSSLVGPTKLWPWTSVHAILLKIDSFRFRVGEWSSLYDVCVARVFSSMIIYTYRYYADGSSLFFPLQPIKLRYVQQLIQNVLHFSAITCSATHAPIEVEQPIQKTILEQTAELLFVASCPPGRFSFLSLVAVDSQHKSLE